MEDKKKLEEIRKRDEITAGEEEASAGRRAGRTRGEGD